MENIDFATLFQGFGTMMESGYLLASAFFNDENNERKINGVLFQENFYNQASAPSKLLKLKTHPSVEQMQRIFSTHLPVEQNASLSFTPSAIRYSYGYYVYELKHILI